MGFLESVQDGFSRSVASQDKQTHACPVCGTNLAMSDAFCVGCGASMTDIRANLQLCVHCGTPLAAGSKFCMGCGATLETLPPVQ